jgi:hypothetical protein
MKPTFMIEKSSHLTDPDSDGPYPVQINPFLAEGSAPADTLPTADEASSPSSTLPPLPGRWSFA